MIAVAAADAGARRLVGLGLYLWLYKTKTGMVIRAGVDDRQMTAALGINLQTVFVIAFTVGARWRGWVPSSAPPRATSCSSRTPSGCSTRSWW